MTLSTYSVNDENSRTLHVRSGILCHLIPLLALAAMPAGAAMLGGKHGTTDEFSEAEGIM